MKLYPGSRRARAVGGSAATMRTSPIDAARGVIRVVNANMERAIRVITVERGFDPRDFALLAFGGAGPMHACELALDLGIAQIVMPRNPGLLCAWGALGAPLGREYSMTVRGSRARLSRNCPARAPMIARARAELLAEGARADPITSCGPTCAIAANPTKSKSRSRRASSPIFMRPIAAPSAIARRARRVEVVNLRIARQRRRICCASRSESRGKRHAGARSDRTRVLVGGRNATRPDLRSRRARRGRADPRPDGRRRAERHRLRRRRSSPCAWTTSAICIWRRRDEARRESLRRHEQPARRDRRRDGRRARARPASRPISRSATISRARFSTRAASWSRRPRIFRSISARRRSRCAPRSSEARP